MTSNWDKFSGKKSSVPEPEMVAMEVGGTFACQLCYEHVDGAEYFQMARLLRWKCSQGHISLVEKFDL